VNGHEWLARKLARHGIRYAKYDNAFLRIEDCQRAQRFADRFPSLDWIRILERLAARVNPLLRDLLRPMRYYWVTTQAEYATDLMFKSRQLLRELYPRLLQHSSLCFGASDVLGFLGRKLRGTFEGEVVTDRFQHELKGRLPGIRVRHRMKYNWIKLYDKVGLVLRVETVTNQPTEFRVRKRVRRNGQSRTEWVPMRKSVAYLFRYRDVSLQSNSRYLNALANVDDPTDALRGLDGITTRHHLSDGRTVKGFNPLARPDAQLFQTVMSGEHALHGFTNRQLREKLRQTATLLHDDPKKQSGQITRLLRRLHAYRLIAKIPHSRRWRVTAFGHQVMAASLHLREINFPQLYAAAA
jgi:hypothetical protein